MSILERAFLSPAARIALCLGLFACAGTMHAQFGTPGGPGGGGGTPSVHIGGSGPDPLSRPARPKTLSGSVRDANGKLVDGAVIYLKNARTSNVSSMSPDAHGVYRFGELSPSDDYQIWAQTTNKKSTVKSVSSFDTRSDLTVNLKIE